MDKSKLVFRVLQYRWLRFSVLCTLFIWIALWNAEMRSRMGWSTGGHGRGMVVGGVGKAFLLLVFTSGLRMLLVGVPLNLYPCCMQGEILGHVF